MASEKDTPKVKRKDWLGGGGIAGTKKKENNRLKSPSESSIGSVGKVLCGNNKRGKSLARGESQ